MDDTDVQVAMSRLYLELIDRVIDDKPLSDRQRTAYFVLDFRVRLETGGFDGIMHDPASFIDAMERVGLIAHASKLKHATRYGPDLLDLDDDAREDCERLLSEISHAHNEGDQGIFDRAVFAFWKASEQGS